MKNDWKTQLFWVAITIVVGLYLHSHKHLLNELYAIPRPMGLAVVLILLFSVYWSVVSKNSKPAESSESTASRQFHLILINGGMIVLILSIPGLTGRFLPQSRVLVAAGLAIEGAGILLAVWSRQVLGSNWSGEVRIATGHQLVRSGPYRRIRHPIYTALLAMYGGTMLVSGEWHALMAMVLITLAYLRKRRMEETALAAAFGDEFTAWRRNTWALFPAIY
jgi:protein-S-isoprenylcysteine O-methyltransferase Ste14